MGNGNLLFSAVMGILTLTTVILVLTPISRTAARLCQPVENDNVQLHATGYMLVTWGISTIFTLAGLYTLIGYTGLANAERTAKHLMGPSKNANFPIMRSLDDIRFMNEGDKGLGFAEPHVKLL